ncbi:MAG: hypothetical protein ACTSPY_18365 [Candidatus Helarchaeota archaeon]
MTNGSNTSQGIHYQTLVTLKRVLEFKSNELYNQDVPIKIRLESIQIDSTKEFGITNREGEDITIFYSDKSKIIFEQVKKRIFNVWKENEVLEIFIYLIDSYFKDNEAKNYESIVFRFTSNASLSKKAFNHILRKGYENCQINNEFKEKIFRAINNSKKLNELKQKNISFEVEAPYFGCNYPNFPGYHLKTMILNQIKAEFNLSNFKITELILLKLKDNIEEISDKILLTSQKIYTKEKFYDELNDIFYDFKSQYPQDFRFNREHNNKFWKDNLTELSILLYDLMPRSHAKYIFTLYNTEKISELKFRYPYVIDSSTYSIDLLIILRNSMKLLLLIVNKDIINSSMSSVITNLLKTMEKYESKQLNECIIILSKDSDYEKLKYINEKNLYHRIFPLNLENGFELFKSHVENQLQTNSNERGRI